MRKNVDALSMRFAYEFDDDVVGIGSVADGVGAAKKHLEANVGNARAQFAQALPRIFVQEAHRSVKRCAAPHFDAEQIREAMGDGAGGGKQIRRSNARGQERLVRVAKSGVGNEQALLFSRPGREFLWSKFLQALAAAGRRLASGR